MYDNGYAVAVGVFDGVHIGHMAVIESAVALEKEGLVPAAFTFSMSGSPKTGGMLISDGLKREYLMRAGIKRIESPDFHEFASMDGESFVRETLVGGMSARAVCCGGDFRFGCGRSCGIAELRDICARSGVKLYVAPEVTDGGEPVSSSRIRAAIAAGDIETANRLLGRRYEFELEVRHGRRLAGRLGFPTINQLWPERFVTPRFGVYASRAHIGGESFAAVTNIGVKPTVVEDGGEGVLAETYIEGFSGDLYGSRVRVELYGFMRPERRFDSIDELKAQIMRDAADAERMAEEERLKIKKV